jgi:hypothetical protein
VRISSYKSGDTVPHNAPGVARTLISSPRVVITVLVALMLLLAALVTGALRATPIAAEESAKAPVGSVDKLPSAKPADLGEPRDPLSIEEIGYALGLAEDSLPASSADVAGESGAELLSVDLASMDPTIKTRPVEVTFYDYGNDEVVGVTVELYAGKVTDVSSADGLQPPPSPAETYEATRLLVHSADAKKVRTEYAAVTGAPISADNVIATGGSYYDTDAVKNDDKCGVHRCVELQLQDPTGLYLSTTDYVVDLSVGKVIVIADRDASSVLSGGKGN